MATELLASLSGGLGTSMHYKSRCTRVLIQRQDSPPLYASRLGPMLTGGLHDGW